MASAPAYDWKDKSGNPLTCREKIKVLDGNMREIAQQCRDALDDALLMGCSEQAFKEALYSLFRELEPTVKERS